MGRHYIQSYIGWEDYRTCSAAAREGHLDILKWARDHGCDWDSETCWFAAQGGHLDVLKWAREHGCDCNLLECREKANFNDHKHILC